MNIFNKIYCRIYQLAFRAALPLLPYRDPEIYNSVGDVSLIFKKLHINNALLVTDSFLKESGATAHHAAYLIFSGGLEHDRTLWKLSAGHFRNIQVLAPDCGRGNVRI